MEECKLFFPATTRHADNNNQQIISLKSQQIDLLLKHPQTAGKK